MKKFVASTALALVMGVPAMAQTTDQTQQVQDPAQDQTMQQQAGGFYQPTGQELFASEIIGQDVYAPQMGQQDAMQQPVDQTAQPTDQQATQDPAAQPADQQVTQDPAAEQQPADQQVTQDPAAEPTDQQVTQDPAAQPTDQQVTQDPAAQPTDQQVTQDPAAQPADQRMAGQTMTQDELGQMENIGQVSEIIFDPEGEIRAVVVGVGGFLGMGEREVALDLDQVNFVHDAENPDQVYVVTRVGADQLENAPQYERETMRDQQVAAQPTDPAATEPAPADPAAAPAQQDQPWMAGRQPMTAPGIEREGYAMAEATEVSVDNLIGANVYDVNDDNIGNVDDVVLGEDGSMQYAVVDVGGFLGFGTHTVAIGFDEMTVLHDEGWADLRVYVDVTQEQLEQMPEYQPAN